MCFNPKVYWPVCSNYTNLGTKDTMGFIYQEMEGLVTFEETGDTAR